MVKKLNLFRHICRNPDERLLKQVVFGIMKGSNRGERQEKMDRWHTRMVFTMICTHT